MHVIRLFWEHVPELCRSGESNTAQVSAEVYSNHKGIFACDKFDTTVVFCLTQYSHYFDCEP